MENCGSYQCSFGELTNLFARKTDTFHVLEPSVGNGSVQVFHLARGLEARFWNCRFNYEIELQGGNSARARSRHFTLLCFLDTRGFTLSHCNTVLHKNILWNTALLSDNCACKIQISPQVNSLCLSISFSESWFRQNLLEKKFSNRSENLSNFNNLSLVGNLNKAETKIVTELMDLSWKKSFGTFYVKSLVLKLVSDVLYRIKQRESFSINHLCLQTRVPEIERYLK